MSIEIQNHNQGFVIILNNPDQQDIENLNSAMSSWQSWFANQCKAILEDANNKILGEKELIQLSQRHQISLREVKTLLGIWSN